MISAAWEREYDGDGERGGGGDGRPSVKLTESKERPIFATAREHDTRDDAPYFGILATKPANTVDMVK